MLQYATLKQLIASKVKCGCRDRARNMDGKSSVKTSNALLTHRILHDLANYLAASYFLAARCIGILDLQLGLDGINRMQNGLAYGGAN